MVKYGWRLDLCNTTCRRSEGCFNQFVRAVPRVCKSWDVVQESDKEHWKKWSKYQEGQLYHHYLCKTNLGVPQETVTFRRGIHGRVLFQGNPQNGGGSFGFPLKPSKTGYLHPPPQQNTHTHTHTHSNMFPMRESKKDH